MRTSDKANIIVAVVAAASLALGIYNQWYIQNLPNSDELVIKGNKHFDNGAYKRAVKYYDEALRIHESDANTWKSKGFALINLGMDDESVTIKRHNRSPYSHAKKVMDYSGSSYQPSHISRDYVERGFQCFEKAVYYNPKDPEARLYKGIACLYLSPCPFCNPIEDFDETLRLIDNLLHKDKSPPLRDIEGYAWHGKGMAYLKIGQKEKANECFRKANETK